MSASELKDQGNAAFAAKKFSRAAELYGKAIAVDPSSSTAHVLYSNRCAALLELGGKSELALADADKCVELNPAFLKGHLRRAMCLQALGRNKDAVEACSNALVIEPSNADVLKLKQQCVKAAAASALDELCKPIPLPEMLRDAQQVLNVRDTLALAFPELAASDGAAAAASSTAPSAASASTHNLAALAARFPSVRLVNTPGRGRSLVAAVDLPAGAEVFTEPAVAWYAQFGDVLGAAIPRLLELAPAFAAAGGNVYAILLQLEPFASAYGLAAAAAAPASAARAAAGGPADAAGAAAAGVAALPADAVADVLARIATAPSRSKADIAIRAARANALSGCFADAINDESSRLLLFAPVLAMLNSDCDPSCRYTVSWGADVEAPVLRLSTLRPVSAGEELSIIYTDPAQPAAERKGELRRYDFECACARCSAAHEDTVVFTCPAPGCASGRVYGNASACADCGAALADGAVTALPNLEHRDGGAWFAARTRYLAAVETGAAAVGRNGVPRVTAVDVALGNAASGRSAADIAKGAAAAAGAAGAAAPAFEAAGAEAASAAGGDVWGSATAGVGTAALPPAPLHITDAGRLHALYATLGAAWALDPRLVARVYATALPAFQGHRMWAPVLPQLHLLAGHVNAAAGDVAAAKEQYAAAAARYAVLYGPAKAHPYTALVAGLADAPPRSRHDVERVEHKRLMEGTWEPQGLPKARAAKWRTPVEAAPGEGKGSGSGSSAAAGGAGVAAELLKLDHGRVADQLKRLTAQVLGTRVDGSPRATAERHGSGGAPAAAGAAASGPASSA